MLHRGRKLLQSRIRAEDGLAGSLYDLYFDDRDKKVIFAVAGRGPEFCGLHTLIAGGSLKTMHKESSEIVVSLTVDEVSQGRRWYGGKPLEACRNHMRSLREVSGYSAWGPDAELGRITDVIITAGDEWSVPYIVVEMDHERAAKSIIIHTSSITSINSEEKRIYTDISSKLLRACPYFPPYAGRPGENEREALIPA